MIRLFLIGYMGTGKTTLGKAFAKELDLSFVDLDWYIEGRYHKSVSQIFTDRGEEGFRQLERNMLMEVSEFEDVVISTGGGTPCFFDNMKIMNERGTTVYLKTDTKILFNRLSIAKRQRPILAGKSNDELLAFITESVERREPFYTQAKFVFDSGRLESIRQIKESIESLQRLIGL